MLSLYSMIGNLATWCHLARSCAHVPKSKYRTPKFPTNLWLAVRWPTILFCFYFEATTWQLLLPSLESHKPCLFTNVFIRFCPVHTVKLKVGFMLLPSRLPSLKNRNYKQSQTFFFIKFLPLSKLSAWNRNYSLWSFKYLHS